MDPLVVQLWSGLGILLGTLCLVAAVLGVGKQLLVQARGVWHVLRGKTAAAVAAVDAPDDALNVQLAQLSGVPAEVWALVLPALLQTVAEGLDDLVSIEQAASSSGAPQ